MNSKIVILDDSVLLYQNYMGNDEWEKVDAFPRGGLTYLIKNNNIKFFAYIDYFYRNCLASMELPLYIIDETMGIDGEYTDISEITEILNRIFPSATGDIDLSPYLKRIDADRLYQPIGDYVTDDELSTVLEDYYTKQETDDLLDDKLDASAYTPVDLTDYYTKQEVDSLIPEVPSLDGYATETWVQNQGYLTQHQPIKTINGYSLIGDGNIQIGSGGTIDAYTKAESDSRFQPIGNYATESWVTNQNYVTYSTLVQNITNLQEQINYLISEISGCCGSSGETQYRWITMTGENDYICSGETKYSKEKKQQSTDGIIWEDVTPAEYRTGEVIEAQSIDCGYTGDTTIVGDAEYRSQDFSGTTWPIHITYSGDPTQITYDYSYPGESSATRRGMTLDKSTGTITFSGVCGVTSQLAWFRISVLVNGSEVKRVSVYPNSRYVTLTGQYACDGFNKYQLYQEQHTYNGTDWCDWSSTTTRDNMTLLEENSVDCGYVPTGETQYRWYQAPASDYICSGTSKYYKEYYQQSTDGGNTWTNVTPTQTRQGSLIENQSTDCGYIAPQYRWYTAPNSDYICSGTTKYQKQYYQVSYDGGNTWQNVTPTQTRTGNIIETQSTDCGYIEPQYRWVDTTATTCSGYNKCYVSRQQVSYDGGTTWQNTSTTGYGTTIEAMSYDCGYVGSPKIKVRTNSGSTYQINCNSDSKLSRSEIERCYDSTPTGECTVFIEIGSCVSSIGDEYEVVYFGAKCITAITIPNTVTYISPNCFENLSNLTGLTLPNNIQKINSSTFKGCSGLTSIDIPASVSYIGTAAFSGCSSLQSITVRATTPPTLGGVAVFETGNGCPIYVPASKVNTYKSAWPDYASRIQAIP